MNNNFKIFIAINNLHKHIELKLDYDKNVAQLNDKNFSMNVRPFMKNICEIVSSWDTEMINKSILDGISYTVQIQKDGKIKKYRCINKFPENFLKFINLLDEVNIW